MLPYEKWVEIGKLTNQIRVIEKEKHLLQEVLL